MNNKQLAVLYVEDDPMSRKLMEMLLKNRMGLTNVTIFNDSERFLEKAEALNPRPDIILLDIHVKPYSGFEMLQMLRGLEWTSGIPIVALTASVMNEEVQELKRSGFNGCLAKPIDLDTFPDKLNLILGGETIWSIIH
jgi:CheY-like chemotaxis protein